jgi:hypothetical protein
MTVLRRHLEEYELVVRELPASKAVNTESEAATALEAVARQQPVKIQQTEDLTACCNELESPN